MMCARSVVTDYYLEQWPSLFPGNPKPWKEDKQTAELLQEILQKLDQLDKRLGDIECHDPAKAALDTELSDILNSG